MFRGVARFTVYVLICVPLLVVAFLITRQIQFTFRLRDSLTQNSSGQLPLSDIEGLLAANELFTRSFFVTFSCFLMIFCGLIIVLKGTGNALKIARDNRVKYALRTAYPGVFLAIAGCLLLTFSIYRAAQTNFETNKQVVALKELNPLRLSRTAQPDRNVSVTSEVVEKQKPAGHSSNTPPQPSNQPVITVKPKSGHSLPVKNESPGPTMKVSAEEVRWADQLAVMAITNGEATSRADRRKYFQVVNAAGNEPDLYIDRKLHWAFKFLLKTESGYQPSDEELDRYEAVVGDYVTKSARTAAQKGYRFQN